MNRLALASGMVLVGSLSLLSCGGGGGDGVVTPTVPNVAGDWMVTVNEQVDTCGIDLPSNATGTMHLIQSGSSVTATILDAFGECQSFLYTLNGNTATATRVETVSDGICTIQVQTRSTLNFSGSHVDGTETHHASYVSGDCGGFTACDWNLIAAGDRCSSCWSGCPSPLQEKETAWTQLLRKLRETQ